MPIALFDLDNTLIAGDSDYLWGEFLVAVGAVERDAHRRENDRFLEQYRAGTLDVGEFLGFQLRPLADNRVEDLLAWRARFVGECIAPLVLEGGRALLDLHRARGDRLAIVTSTNAFITRPIADLLGVEELLATEPEFDGVRYTGRFLGTPCSGEGKVAWVEAWIERDGLALEGSWFYSDSHTDIPLLSVVDNPVAVDPDTILRAHALRLGWPVTSLR